MTRSEIVDSAFAFSFRKAKTNKWVDDRLVIANPARVNLQLSVPRKTENCGFKRNGASRAVEKSLDENISPSALGRGDNALLGCKTLTEVRTGA